VKSNDDPLITLAEVATHLGITRYRVNWLISEKLLTEVPRPALMKPGFKTSEVKALKLKFYNRGGGARE
jgi:predicted DNA-binding transcriptional regulator AlpA